MREVGKNKHQAAWAEAMDAKFEGKGDPYGREQFDKILGDFEVNIDDPFPIPHEPRGIISRPHWKSPYLAKPGHMKDQRRPKLNPVLSRLWRTTRPPYSPRSSWRRTRTPASSSRSATRTSGTAAWRPRWSTGTSPRRTRTRVPWRPCRAGITGTAYVCFFLPLTMPPFPCAKRFDVWLIFMLTVVVVVER